MIKFVYTHMLLCIFGISFSWIHYPMIKNILVYMYSRWMVMQLWWCGIDFFHDINMSVLSVSSAFVVHHHTTCVHSSNLKTSTWNIHGGTLQHMHACKPIICMSHTQYAGHNFAYIPGGLMCSSWVVIPCPSSLDHLLTRICSWRGVWVTSCERGIRGEWNVDW